MEGFELKLDTKTGTLAVADHVPVSSRSPRNSSHSRLRPKSAGGSRSRSHRHDSSHVAAAKAGASLGAQAAAALIAGDTTAQDKVYKSTLHRPIQHAKTTPKTTRRLRKSASRSSRGTIVKGKRRKSKKKSSRKSLKALARQQELEMYRSELRTEREKSTRELDSFRQKTEFLRHRHQTSSDDKDHELRDMRLRCRELEENLATVADELQLTKQQLDAEQRRVGEYQGDDFRDADSARLSQLEEAARHLLFNVAEERRLRLHCAQCDNPLVSVVHSEASSSNGGHTSPRKSTHAADFRSSSKSSKSAFVREDEQLVVFYPCRHARFCTKCARKMDTCQVCSREIHSKVLLINSKLR